jgi:hypothetical protein
MRNALERDMVPNIFGSLISKCYLLSRSAEFAESKCAEGLVYGS